MKELIVGLSKDRKGLLVRVKTMSKDNYWHKHSTELSSYQKKVRDRLRA